MRMYYVKKAPDPALLEGRRKLRASDFDEFYAFRFDFNETTDVPRSRRPSPDRGAPASPYYRGR